MGKVLRSVLVLSVVVWCGVLWVGSSALGQAKAQSDEQIKDPYQTSRILVEAFVVEVKIDALQGLGVSPIGQKPNSVSTGHILRCLKDGSGKVTAGAKVGVKQHERGEMAETETVSIRLPSQSTSYTVGKQFSVEAQVMADGKVTVGFKFSQNTLGPIDAEGGLPPSVVTRSWKNLVCLDAAKPTIVGATQNQETAVFLILSAHIDNK